MKELNLESMKEFSHQEIGDFTGYSVDNIRRGRSLKKVEWVRGNMWKFKEQI